MKLELKYLSPYLPYDVRIARFTANDKFKRVEYSLRAGNLQEVVRCDNLKPILRPLSDLNKEIEVNGQKFIPINWVENQYPNLDLHNQCKFILDDESWINQCEYLLIQHLFEWHYDIFNLIENNLAIDINTINQ